MIVVLLFNLDYRLLRLGDRKENEDAKKIIFNWLIFI
jgi:hypothetical protein